MGIHGLLEILTGGNGYHAELELIYQGHTMADESDSFHWQGYCTKRDFIHLTMTFNDGL